jgi:hypothetical protein
MASKSPMKAEKQTCPARSGFGPWDHAEGLDRWRTDRWGNWLTRWWEHVAHGAGDGDHARAMRINHWLQSDGVRRFKRRVPLLGKLLPYGLTIGGTYWVGDKKLMPRSCSFCGSSHPEDVMKLLDAGWKVEVCDNRGKCYVRPPNSYGPVPPVKVKTYHCTEEQIKRLNECR